MSESFVEEVGAIDTDYLTDYQEVAKRTGPPPPGAYYLQLPFTIGVEDLDLGGRKGLEFDLSGATIVSDKNGNTQYAGRGLNKFYRANTLSKGEQKFSEAGDILKSFGIDVVALGGDKKKWIDAFKSIEGQTTPNPVYLTYNGRYKGSDGKTNYLKADAFKVKNDDGTVTYKRLLYLNNGQVVPAAQEEEFLAKQAAASNVTTLDETQKRSLKKVWANFEPGFRGFASQE